MSSAQSFQSNVQAATPTSPNSRHIPTSPHSPSSHSWKSFLRRPSTKKLAANTSINGSALTLNTNTLSSPVNGSSKSPITPSTSLTPGSILSVEQRSSSNSSNTQSTDSNVGQNTRPYPSQGQRPYSSYQQQPSSVDALSAGIPKVPRTRTKSERHTQRAALGRSGTNPGVVQSAHPSQTSFSPRSPPSTNRQSPRSPSKSMGALPRFIRRVASAPNAKDLFSPKRSSTTTKNGFLAPSEDIPPVPALPTTSLEQGTDSLETLSSGSSRGRPSRPVRGHNSMPNADGSGAKAAFRRTYSSNSIKIRSVSSSTLLDHSTLLTITQVEVSPSSFLKIKLLGKGDVGRVYLVREKKSNKLFAMKGKFSSFSTNVLSSMTLL